VNRLTLASGLLMLLLAAGCATPASRIRRNPDLFASFPAAAQELIRQGRIELGFNPDMVRMALGAPDRTYRRTTAAGETLVWAYLGYEIDHDARRLPHTIVEVQDSRGHTVSRRIVTHYPWYRERDREYEALRVEFRDEEVVAVERVDR